ncbi:septin-4 isoform X3 [Heterocephalus glaber]|uniref:Septin-4 isoform X3 n=1 Tax=Heterocephalus glaber TaxID=10181 RepID=A0AAX6S785_HETGA|nr:septin-4 isoform X3 [Heterocephalus glaber]
MASTQKGTVFQILRTNKSGSKVAHRGPEFTSPTSQRGHEYIFATSQQSAAVSGSPPPQRAEAAPPTTSHSASYSPHTVSPQSGPSLYTASTPRGTETRPRVSNPQQKSQQVHTAPPHPVSIHRNVKEEATRRGGEIKPGCEVGCRTSLTPNAKSSCLLSFIDEKDTLESQNLQEDPPSKVQNPQGVRVPRRISSYPKDEAVQTEPTGKILTGEVRSPRSPTSPEHGSSRVATDHRAAHKRSHGQESQMDPYTSVLLEPKALHRNMKLTSSLKLSVLKDLDGGHRVPPRHSEHESLYKRSVSTETRPSKVLISPDVEPSVRSSIRDNEVSCRVTMSSPRQSVQSTLHPTARAVPDSPRKSLMYVTPESIHKQQIQRPAETNYMYSGPAVRYPEPSRKPSIHAELELTPWPLAPRSLPKYGPDSSWWALLNPQVEMPQSLSTTLDFEPKSPLLLDTSESLYEMDSIPFCEDLIFQREKASPRLPRSPKESSSQLPLREVPQDPKYTNKQLKQRFNAFFLDVSEEMQNRIIWWLKDEEDDKEYVGFATLPNQVHRKSVKKGFDFTLMVAGESGLGKSTLVNSLFLTDLYRDRKLLNAEERIMQTVEITKHAVDIEEKGVRLRLTIVDTPGFGDALNNTECWKPVAEYIDQQFEQYFRDESGLNRKNIQDNRVHCCLYFISPFGHGLRPLDVEFMKALHQRVNIVPILAKADTLTRPEVDLKKRKIREDIEHFGIKIYQFPDCDSDEDEDFKLQDQALKESIPFAVIGSNTVVEARGRRVRGRLYPWGIVEVENPGHCDFVKLRTMLVRTHMQDLKDVTRETHYENYRAQCIQSMTRLVVKERNRNKLTRESGTDFPIPAVPPGTDPETEKLIREKDEELRRMQEMLHKIQRQMKETH